MRTQIVSLAVASALLGGCVSVLPTPIIPSALISLPADRAVAPSDPLQADVAVFMPEASRAFAGADIAVRDGQELIYLSDVRWADAAPALLQGAVVSSLSKTGGPGRAAPGQLGARTDYDLRWILVDLSTGKGAAPVRIEVQASLMDTGTRRMIAQQSFTAEGSPSDASARARAAALAIASQKVADQVAAFVAKTAAAKPAN
ncbi:MAG: ABC-type transport auxiliary lipoprotein family protein [Hyphomonadaceae bacterium]|nr:ABC-type transport auxiliary lipoprotein family protein [Hyphomonadaceae bacterium]